MKNNTLNQSTKERKIVKLPYQDNLRVNSDDYWFTNFTPDIEVEGDSTLISLIRELLLVEYYHPEINTNFRYCIDIECDGLLKKFLNANVFFLSLHLEWSPTDNTTDRINTTIGNMMIDKILSVSKTKKANKNPDGASSSIQITLDTGDKFIFICQDKCCPAFRCCDFQLLYEYNNIKAITNEDIDYYDFCRTYGSYIDKKLTETLKKEAPAYEKRKMKGSYYQIKTNKRKYFWLYKFKNFKPDKEIKGNKEHCSLIRKLGMEFELGIDRELPIYKVPKKLQKDTHIYFIHFDYQQEYIEYMRKNNIDIDDKTLTVQITLNNGEKHIFALGHHYPFEKEQAIFEYEYYKANKERYKDYTDFIYNHFQYVHAEINKLIWEENT